MDVVGIEGLFISLDYHEMMCKILFYKDKYAISKEIPCWKMLKSSESNLTCYCQNNLCCDQSSLMIYNAIALATFICKLDLKYIFLHDCKLNNVFWSFLWHW